MIKLKAFTLMEVTISMLIAAIVIGIAYLSYSIMLRSHHQFTRNNGQIAALEDLDHVIKLDFDHANIIVKNDSGMVCGKDSAAVTYLISDHLILRKTTRTDTFKVSVLSAAGFFENAPVSGKESDSEKNRIDKLELELTIGPDTLAHGYYKTYSSEDLKGRTANAN